jgi:sugar lactone lactonase YvrE
VTVQSSVFADAGLPALAWLENLGFDGRGGMWVSELVAGRVVRYDAGAEVTASIPVSFPGAIELGADGLMYVNYGNTVLPFTPSGVDRFDPTAPAPTGYASGLTSANGGAFDQAGNLYVTNDTSNHITRIRPGGAIDWAWTNATNVFGANGAVVTGNSLYAAITTDLTSPVVRVPLNNPGASSVVAWLGVALELDDLTLGPDGYLYVASALGELVRVDPTTGASCVLYTGPPLTSVRFPKAFGGFDARWDLFLTSETGLLIHLKLSA